jgi:hypothetical protein
MHLVVFTTAILKTVAVVAASNCLIKAGVIIVLTVDTPQALYWAAT